MKIISDNLQITNPLIEKAVLNQDPVPIQNLVKQSVQLGALAIDINSGPLSKHPEKMAFLVQAVQKVTDLPLLLDTSNPEALEAGLEVCKNIPIINGFSLEEQKIENILPLAKKFDCDIIGYLLFANGHVPSNGADRLNVALELFTKFSKTGLDPDKLIIDPIIAPLLWDNGIQQNMEILSVIKTLPDLLGYPVKTIAGLSNLTTGKGLKSKKLLMEKTYTSMLAAAGLNMVLLNVFHDKTLETIRACNIMTSNKIFTWETI